MNLLGTWIDFNSRSKSPKGVRTNLGRYLNVSSNNKYSRYIHIKSKQVIPSINQFFLEFKDESIRR